MAFTSLVILLALGTLCQGSQMDVSAVSSLRFNTQAAKNRPVSKVIVLLKDMLKQLEAEAENDQETYDKFACWCITNDKGKSKAIKDAGAKLDLLGGQVAEYGAWSLRLSMEIKAHAADMTKIKASLETAKAIRAKELAEFNAAEQDLLASISSLKSAITVLSKHHSASALIQVASTAQHEMRKHADLLKGVLTQKQRREVSAFVSSPVSFLQAPADYFDAEPTFKQSYAPASGEILGILKQMMEEFEGNLSQMQKDELAAQQAYEEMKASLEHELKTVTASYDKKTLELANVDEKLCIFKLDLEDTKKKLSADEKYLIMVKEMCSKIDRQWEQRQRDRQLEMEAVAKALAILSSDDAHDLFTKSFNPSLLQTEDRSNRQLQIYASELVRAAAMHAHSPRLAVLAARVRLDAFTKVKKAIDDMIAALMKEKEDEIKHKDWCIDDLNTNQLETEKAERHKNDVESKIEDLEMTIAQLTKEIAAIRADIELLHLELKRASLDREAENKEFQEEVADQRATQKLLQQALTVLKGFYDFLQRGEAEGSQAPAGPPPPPGFQNFSKSKAAGGVMGMIQQIINDAKAMEAQAIVDEESAQKEYEGFVKETNASIKSATEEMVNKSEEKAQAETDLGNAHQEHEAVKEELSELSDTNQQLHSSCDFILKNFDLRQTAREEEIEALKQAKAILSGAKFKTFLQR